MTLSELRDRADAELVRQLTDVSTVDGLMAAARDMLILFPAVLAVMWIGQSLLYSLHREWRNSPAETYAPTVAVVVPAHNEEILLAPTIDALLAQTYRTMTIHVVSDGSTDRTAEIARSYAPRGVVLHERRAAAGKSAALQWALERVDADLFMVVDADTIAEPEAIERMIRPFSDPHIGAVTGSPRVGNVVNPITALQAMEYSVIVSLAKRADQFWGGLYTVSGAAACFRRTALNAVGGWSDASVTEDIEVSWRLQHAGWRLGYEAHAIFRIQVPQRIGALLRQRRRWAQGMIEVGRLHWRAPAGPNRSLIPIAAQVAASTAWLTMVTLYLGASALTALAGDGISVPMIAGAITLRAVFVWTLVLFLLQAATATLLDGAYIRGERSHLALAVLFPLYFWLIIYPAFLGGLIGGLRPASDRRWNRTERSPVLGSPGPATRVTAPRASHRLSPR